MCQGTWIRRISLQRSRPRAFAELPADSARVCKACNGLFFKRVRYIVRIYWCDYITTSTSNFLLQVKDLVLKLPRDDVPSTDSFKKGIESPSKVQNTDCNIESLTMSNIKIRLQTFPRELAAKLIDEIPELDGAMHGFSHSFYAVKTDGVIRYGIGKGEDMYLVACDREALFKGAVAKACSKLEEALHVKGIKLTQDMLVLDVGAAPGAWTEFLSKRVCHVVAIDPGKLDKTISGGVTHICKKAQDAITDLVLWTKGRNFDLLVCDINKHPAEAAEIVVPLLKFLKDGGFVILTLKFHGRGKNKDDKVAELETIFKDSLTDMESIWLLANSIYERTFVGVKK
ncbi:hypothetical protein GOP47_0001167 [Adiantum capillus-veneris]|uniref:Ribosomal RNA methyltransferase FtsJ domain-containing protein n=1 Tax=Adiantum capillus-veneris TaxID=13818 RepID=A0A9D4ZRF4_ADICA|nr:hypothetical protein GOP47_0001167 [Adiantum capillus-veneris]